MKLISPLVGAIIALAPSVAHADEKAEAILKEARLRMSRANTYTVQIRNENDSSKVGMHFFMKRPDKFRLDLTEAGSTGAMVRNGEDGALIDNGERTRVTANSVRHLIDTMYSLVSLNFIKSIKDPITTTYITQKMLDEKVRVDIIEVKEKGSDLWIRLYIDNNSLLRKAVASGKGQNSVMLFTDITIDEPVPDEKFSVK